MGDYVNNAFVMGMKGIVLCVAVEMLSSMAAGHLKLQRTIEVNLDTILNLTSPFEPSLQQDCSADFQGPDNQDNSFKHTIMDFNVQVVEALLTESCQEPSSLKLRTAIESIDGENQDVASAMVDELLASRNTSTQSITFDQLMHRLGTTSTTPSQVNKADDLPDLTGESSLNECTTTKLEGVGPWSPSI